MADVFFNGPEGRIEGKYFKAQNPGAPVALVLHPHPMHGGTMNNKVVYAIYRALALNGVSVLRINFRGVGKSQGQYDNGVGEMIDAATALDWLQRNHPSASRILMCGFSFGAWVGMQVLMRRPEITDFIAISPPVNKYDFSFLSPCPVSGLIVQGNMDSVVTEESVTHLVDRISTQKNIQIEYHIMDGADHFYRNKIEQLEQIISQYIEQRMQEQKKQEEMSNIVL